MVMFRFHSYTICMKRSVAMSCTSLEILKLLTHMHAETTNISEGFFHMVNYKHIIEDLLLLIYLYFVVPEGMTLLYLTNQLHTNNIWSSLQDARFHFHPCKAAHN